MNIGFTKGSHPELRCIVGKVPGATYRKVEEPRVLQILGKLERRLLRRDLSFFDFFHVDGGSRGIDSFHFFNGVSNTTKPWATTFETLVPRENWYLNVEKSRLPDGSFKTNSLVRYKLGLLASKDCKAILALSECNHRLQLQMLDAYPELKDRIVRKMCVIPPPQEVLLQSTAQKSTGGRPVSFSFVGRDFYRKGGPEVLEAFDRLANDGITDFELTVVGELDNVHNYALRGFQDSRETVSRLESLINKHSQINHYPSLSYDKVVTLMRESDVGLLPTWADTYGYSVLEYQAAGCPVISTNVRALPEINSAGVGWLINLPIDQACELRIRTLQDKESVREKIVEGIYRAAREAIENPAMLSEMGERCIQRIRREHCPHRYAERLRAIYVG